MVRHPARQPADPSRRRATFFLPFFLPLLVLLTAVVYWPGLSGPFLFDDFANLDALGQYGGVRDLETLRLFVLGGHSGPAGRPIALLSFLLDSTTWPADPRPFKLTNLLLHLLNGVILFALTRLLLLLSGKLTPGRSTFAALLAAGAWLLHPFLVSTVLYPVQRMAILSTLFTLLGLWGYTHGRLLLAKKPLRAYMWMSVSLAGGTVLAILSKENGVLLPLLALIVEITLLRSFTTTRPDKRWSFLFLWIPAALPFAYVLFRAVNGSLAASFLQRPFDVWERLLTESRILFDYLGWLFFPRVHSPGLLIQKYTISHSFMDPPVTLLAVLGIAGLIFSAFYYRKRFPFFSLAVLFFFTAHVLESGPLPLELYFEHRNYLPAVFLFLPVMVMLSKPHTRYPSLVIIGPALLIALALLTSQRAGIWGNAERLAYNWADINPYSQRAQRYAALAAEQSGKPELAIAILEKARERMPGNVMFGLHALVLQCRYHTVTQVDIDAFIELIEKPYKFRTYEAWHSFVEYAPTPECKGIGYDDVMRVLATLKQNTVTLGSRNKKQRILHLTGVLEANNGNRSGAYESFMEAQRVKPDIERGLLQSSILATHQYYPEALSLLEHADQTYSKRQASTWPKRRGQLDYRLEINTLREQIQKDLHEQAASQ